MFSGEAFRRDVLTTRYDAPDSLGGRPALPRGARLALEARLDWSAQGCTIRLPVRAEYVTVQKMPVVVEEVVVSTAQVADTAHVDETARREELRVDSEGDVRVSERGPDSTGVFWQR
jgi:stress response protein YsnF